LAPSQGGLQYALPGAAVQLHCGFAHFADRSLFMGSSPLLKDFAFGFQPILKVGFARPLLEDFVGSLPDAVVQRRFGVPRKGMARGFRIVVKGSVSHEV
jgi:hypothetical protein